MRRLTADDRAEGDDACEPPCFASAIAASGSSNAPGTGTTVTAS